MREIVEDLLAREGRQDLIDEIIWVVDGSYGELPASVSASDSMLLHRAREAAGRILDRRRRDRADIRTAQYYPELDALLNEEESIARATPAYSFYRFDDQPFERNFTLSSDAAVTAWATVDTPSAAEWPILRRGATVT